VRPLLAILFAGAFFATAPVLAKENNGQDATVMSTESFLEQHPDIHYRLLGLKAYRAKKFGDALAHFRRAARFADKPSQGMVAEMLWAGEGTPADRALAYAWMDLAAERDYNLMLVRREVFWQSLDAGERARALAEGKAIYAEFGDEVTQPRLERLLRAERRRVTGSRLGFVGNVQIVIPSPTGDVSIDASHYYQDKFWKPEEYWKWQERDWKPPAKGHVEVGPLKSEGPPKKP